MQADFLGIQPVGFKSLLPVTAGGQAAAVFGHQGDVADPEDFTAIMACLLAGRPQTRTEAAAAEPAGFCSHDVRVADSRDPHTMLREALINVGLRLDSLQDLISAGDPPAGSDLWNCRQNLLESLSLAIQEAQQWLTFDPQPTFATVSDRCAAQAFCELASSDLGLPDAEGPSRMTSSPAVWGRLMDPMQALLTAARRVTGTPTGFEQPAAPTPAAASEGVLAGLLGQMQALLAAARRVTGSEQPVPADPTQLTSETGRSDGIAPGNQTSDAGLPQTQITPGSTAVQAGQNAIGLLRTLPLEDEFSLRTTPQSSKGEPGRTPSSQSAAGGFREGGPHSNVAAGVDLPETSQEARKPLSAGDALVSQDRSRAVDMQAAEETKFKAFDIRQAENLPSPPSAGDRSSEAVFLTRDTPQAQEALRSQALHQIVQKASVHLQNGQSEVRIELKPEFLGQIRLQIVTENHQVTLRVFTEFPFVKDLIEHNIQQLRAELQQHGLKMDVLDVSVNDGSRYAAGGQSHSGQSKAGAAGSRSAFKTPGDLQEAEAAQATPVRRLGNSAIDCFI